jgi:hypothetical protein
MSLSFDYNNLLPEIQVMNPRREVCPNMPVFLLVEEIDNLNHWFHNDQITLSRIRLESDELSTLS